MYYDSKLELWHCYICDFSIKESREEYNKRLLKANERGKYYVPPPEVEINPTLRDPFLKKGKKERK